MTKSWSSNLYFQNAWRKIFEGLMGMDQNSSIIGFHRSYHGVNYNCFELDEIKHTHANFSLRISKKKKGKEESENNHYFLTIFHNISL